MAIKCSLIIVISIYEVTSYIHPYAGKPYYPRGRRPAEMISYVMEPNIFQSSYASPYSYSIPENKPSYPFYPKPVEPNPANYQIYQQPADPIPANYPVYQPAEPKSANYPVYQPVEPRPANYPVYQPAEPGPANYLVYQPEEPRPANHPVYQPAEPGPANYLVYQPEEPRPANYPVYQPAEPKPETQPILPPVEVQPIYALKNNKPATNGFDSNILNNLAIALQLLILNNLMSNPVPSVPCYDPIRNAIEETKAALNKPCEPEFDYPVTMPNAKFLGSSNFDDASSLMGIGNYGSPPPSPRIGSILKSPYDYLSAQSSDFTASSKSNFQSPYGAIFAPDNMKDLFSMTDYY